MNEKHKYTPLSVSELNDTEFIWFKYEKFAAICVNLFVWSAMLYNYSKIFRKEEIRQNLKGLKPGYFGYLKDHNDLQWKEFRDNLPLMMFVAALFLIKSLLLTFSTISHSFGYLDSLLGNPPVCWHLLFNLSILRMTSYSIDKHYMLNKKSEKKNHLSECKECNSTTICLKKRQNDHRPIDNYEFFEYFAFLSYPPLFISGPISTFNSWISQVYEAQNTHSQKDVLVYVLRTFFDFLCFEIFLHIFFVNAIATNPENRRYLDRFTNFENFSTGFTELIFLWFKFLTIWRIARAWALLDGIETHENMNRCVLNNYCFEGFWRSWHRSFNQWLIRYIFIPTGGSKNKYINIWIVFTYVAIWHDWELNLILWAWGICFALIPEIFIKSYFGKIKWIWKKHWFKYSCLMAGGISVYLMVISNLIGYGIGYQGIMHFIEALKSKEGIILLFFYRNFYVWLFLFFIFYGCLFSNDN